MAQHGILSNASTLDAVNASVCTHGEIPNEIEAKRRMTNRRYLSILTYLLQELCKNVLMKM